MEALSRTVFAEEYLPVVNESSNNDYAFEFSVPVLGTFGVVNLNPHFWYQLTVLVLLQSILNVALAFIIYKFIIKRGGSLESYLLGYGAICPFVLYVPFYIIRALKLRNNALKLGFSIGRTSLHV